MTKNNIYIPSSDVVKNAHVNSEQYEKMCRSLFNDPDVFLDTHGKRIDWIKPYKKISNISYAKYINQMV